MLINSTYYSAFGALLKDFRKRGHFTQLQLAESIGVHRSAIGRWEQGDFLPASKAIVLEIVKCLSLDDQEARQLLEASLTAPSPLWSIPLPRNPFFTGREPILEALHTQLGAAQIATSTQSYALYGLGGVGKTQIALEYAYRHALEYSAVFWIKAETTENVVADLLRIAEILQLPGQGTQDQQHAIAAVQDWLNTHGQWLLVWDNIEDLALLARFLPSVKSGAILLTTRYRILGTLAQGRELLPMEQKEGMLFLLRRAKVLEAEATDKQVQQLAVRMFPQYTAAMELVLETGGLPLALDQAGAYLEETQCGLPAYLDLFRTRRAFLLQQRGEGSRDHPAPVSTTFTLAITRTSQRHPAVWNLLQVCALLQPDAIPEELFQQGAKHLGATLEEVCCDPIQWNRLIAIACSYSLLSRQAEEQTLSMHRLVQAILLDTMAEAGWERWTRLSIEVLDAVFPDVLPTTKYSAWKLSERLLPHALLCLHRAEIAEDSLAFASLTHKVAQYLRERGRYTEAEVLYQRALSLREQLLGADHPDVASSQNYLAILYVEQGRYAEAEPLFQQALSTREQALGLDHPDVARVLINLAALFRRQGKDVEAEELLQRALQISKQALGPDHPLVAVSLNNLAELYAEQGKEAEADPLLRYALCIREQALGPNHPQTASTLCNLAELYTKQGKYAEAEPLFLQALCIREQSRGTDHPDVASVLVTLAELYTKQGKYTEAEPLLQRALQISELALGPDHPLVAVSLHSLASLFREQSKDADAQALFQRALSIRRQHLGSHHPDTAQTLHALAMLCQRQGKPGEAISLAVEPPSRENDPLQGFLDTCCQLHPRAWSRTADLWQAYEQWTQARQEPFPFSRRAFIAQLKAHGCHADRTSASRIWRGITIRTRKV